MKYFFKNFLSICYSRLALRLISCSWWLRLFPRNTYRFSFTTQIIILSQYWLSIFLSSVAFCTLCKANSFSQLFLFLKSLKPKRLTSGQPEGSRAAHKYPVVHPRKRVLDWTARRWWKGMKDSGLSWLWSLYNSEMDKGSPNMCPCEEWKDVKTRKLKCLQYDLISLCYVHLLKCYRALTCINIM